MSNDDEARAIHHRMSEVRRDLVFAFDEASASARQWKDWRYYVHRFPWASAAIVAAVGYLLVPKRTHRLTPTTEQLEEIARRSQLVLNTNQKPQRSGDSLSGKLMALVLAGVGRAAIAYFNGIMQSASQQQSSAAPSRSQPEARTPK